MLSVYTLLREAPPELRPVIEQHVTKVVDAAAFAKHARHNAIAHRNLAVALGVTEISLGSRKDVRGALRALDDLLHAVESHFLKAPPTCYDGLSTLGGVDSLLDIVARGLKSRDTQFGFRRHSHPPDE